MANNQTENISLGDIMNKLNQMSNDNRTIIAGIQKEFNDHKTSTGESILEINNEIDDMRQQNRTFGGGN